MFIDSCCTIGTDSDTEPSAKQLLEQMDSAQVDKAVINPPDRCFAWDNQEGNELIAETIRQYPNRFIPAFTVNPWRKDSWQTIEKYLDFEQALLTFSPGIQGFILSGRKLDPILEKISQKNQNIPIYIHTGHHSNAAPSQLALLAKRFSSLNFIMGHCGATDYHDDVVSVAKLNRNIYLESSFARPHNFIAKLASTDFNRGLMGSGFPYNNFSFEWSQMRHLLPQEQKNAVLGNNIQRLLGAGNAD